jgi:hypothetical protein
VSGRGFDARHVYLGFPTQTDVNDAAKGFGLKVDFGDQVAQVKAIIADINKRGGLLGRTVVPIFHDIKTAQLAADAASAAQATCTALTQDHPVIGVVNLVGGIDNSAFYGCMAQRHTPVFSGGLYGVDDDFFRQFQPYLYKISGPSWSQISPIWVDRLAAERYFTGWRTTTGGPGTAPVKVGLLYPDRLPESRAFTALKQLLTSRGYDVAATFAYDLSSQASLTTSLGRAVLPFASAGVTHVLSDSSTVFYFMQAAEAQHYRPRYALTTYHAPFAALASLGAPAAQLAGSLGIGWFPLSDVDDPQDPGDVGVGARSCRDALVRGGQTGVKQRSVALIAFVFCDGINMVVRAAAAGGLDPAGISQGLQRVGPTFASALTWRSALANHPYVPGAVRDLGFDGSCTCFTYLSRTLTAVG